MMKYPSALFGPSGRALSALRPTLTLLGISGEDIQTVNRAFQERYLQKKPNGLPRERWQLQTLDVPAAHELREALRPTGMIDAITPTRRSYAGLSIFGALQPRICIRLAHAITLLNDIFCPSVILLAGQRDLQLDGQESIDIIRNHTDPLVLRKDVRDPSGSLVMETDLMEWYWQEADMPNAVRQIPWSTVDAPKVQPENRPTTASQLEYWLTKKPAPGHYLMVSNQPHVFYQQAVARNIIPASSGITLECVGPAASDNLSSEFLLGELARRIYEEHSAWLKSQS